MQTWMPPPKPMCSAAFPRSMSKRSGSGNTLGSRFAEPNSSASFWPCGTGPARDLDPVLEHPALEELEWGSQRISSSTARAGVTSPATRRSHSSRMAQQGTDSVAEGVHGRLVARVQEHDDRRDDLGLGQAPTIDACLHEGGDHVVARLTATPLDQIQHVAAELSGRLGGSRGLRVGRVELVHLHHRVRPVQEVAPPVGGYPEHPADHADRVRLGIVPQELHATALRIRLEQLARQLRGGCAQALDAPRGEGRGNQLAGSACARAARARGGSTVPCPRTPASAGRAALRRTRRRRRRAGSCGRAACRASRRARPRAGSRTSAPAIPRRRSATPPSAPRAWGRGRRGSRDRWDRTRA